MSSLTANVEIAKENVNELKGNFIKTIYNNQNPK